MATESTASQDAAARSRALDHAALAGRNASPATATGKALRADDEEIPTGAGRGAPNASKDVPKTGDFAEHTPPKPAGLQKEEATFTHTGTIPPGMVSSSAGLVPASIISDDGEREARIEATLTIPDRGDSGEKLTDEFLETLDGPSLRAIGVQRGYDMPDYGGRRTMLETFKSHQKADKRSSRRGTIPRPFETAR